MSYSCLAPTWISQWVVSELKKIKRSIKRNGYLKDVPKAKNVENCLKWLVYWNVLVNCTNFAGLNRRNVLRQNACTCAPSLRLLIHQSTHALISLNRKIRIQWWLAPSWRINEATTDELLVLCLPLLGRHIHLHPGEKTKLSRDLPYCTLRHNLFPLIG